LTKQTTGHTINLGLPRTRDFPAKHFFAERVAGQAMGNYTNQYYSPDPVLIGPAVAAVSTLYL